MSPESRAEYFRNLRKVMVDKDKAEALDRKLADRGETRTEWFRKKLDEELSEK
mgnify:CR=1 FL=1